ncbi:MAG: DUF3987 domain-containing protein [Bacteroidaceae bacterium]|nr:DUF3987 domain-containing protein [Bacteroidaceae bacterium]
MSRIDLGLNIKNPRTVAATVEGFYKAADSERTRRICAELADALEMCRRGELSVDDYKEMKRVKKTGCQFYTPHAHFAKGYKRNDGEPVDSGKAVIDLDGCEHFAELYAERLKGRERALGIDMVNRSVSGTGGHVLFEIPEGLTREQAQAWMAQEMGGVAYDTAVHELERAIFIPCRDYILYIDEELMFGDEARPTTLPQNQTQTPSPLPLKGEDGHLQEGKKGNGQDIPPSPFRGSGEGVCSFKGIPYAAIIAEYWRRTGGEPVEGERNDRLHRLAGQLRYITDNNEATLMAIMPRYGLSEDEMQGLIHSACTGKFYSMPKLLASIVNALSRKEDDEEQLDTDADLAQPSPSLTGGIKGGSLPVGLKESLAGVPESMYMPVLCAVLPLAAAYADQVEVEYCDGFRQHLGLMSIIRGEQASGKSVCKAAVDVWKRQLDEEDAIARRREEEWKERKKGRKANEKAPEDPKVLIRQVPVTVSCSTLLKRFKNAGGHTIYSFGEELDTLRKTNGAGSWSSKYDIYRLSFDRGEWGQDYNSDQAESGVVNVAYNWTMLGTDGAMRKCFKQDNIENGLSSRVLVAEMPDGSFAKMPKYGKRTPADEARIQEAVAKLRSYAGFIDTPRLRRAIERWVEEKRVEAAKDIDRVKDVYRKRAAVIGFRCGVVYYLLEGKETKRCLDFALMMAEYTLEQQIKAFGEALRNEYVNAQDECLRYGSNHTIFDQLPPTFTMEDVRSLKHGFCNDNSLRSVVSRWRRDGWIDKTDAKHWTKKNVAL